MGFKLSGSSIEAATLAALGKSFAIIEFKPDGDILSANQGFCDAIGYKPSEIVGRHHRMFVDPAFANSAAYGRFWDDLREGRFQSGEFKRLRKDGSSLWIRASYTPVVNKAGKVVKVVKLALDISAEHVAAAKNESMLQAIYRSQAVIRFSLEGEILEANDNFLKAMGYSQDEVVGRHHRMFVGADYANSAGYSRFWERLRGGEFISDEFYRQGKGGRGVWLQAQYNPVFDPDGRVVEVVKIATDLTERMRQVGLVGEALSDLSHGHLGVRVNETLMPSLDSLRVAFNTSAKQLSEAMAVVTASAMAVNGGADEIASSADGIARRSEQQAASLEETAAAVDEITATVDRTAAGAKHANNVVERASRHAQNSRSVVESAIEAMGGIERSSSQIGQIIGVIDEIAFQTNLLALNAGVEAARAGEAGRGFAVVAQEVRALAQRSAEAAREIKALIATSSQHVDRGVKMVGDAGTALNEILAQIGEIEGLVADIAHSAQEQASGLNQVSSAVGDMDKMLQQNAGMVEEANAAAHLLKAQARELSDTMSRFDTQQTPSARALAA